MKVTNNPVIPVNINKAQETPAALQKQAQNPGQNIVSPLSKPENNGKKSKNEVKQQTAPAAQKAPREARHTPARNNRPSSERVVVEQERLNSFLTSVKAKTDEDKSAKTARKGLKNASSSLSKKAQIQQNALNSLTSSVKGDQNNFFIAVGNLNKFTAQDEPKTAPAAQAKPTTGPKTTPAAQAKPTTDPKAAPAAQAKTPYGLEKRETKEKKETKTAYGLNKRAVSDIRELEGSQKQFRAGLKKLLGELNSLSNNPSKRRQKLAAKSLETLFANGEESKGQKVEIVEVLQAVENVLGNENTPITPGYVKKEMIDTIDPGARNGDNSYNSRDDNRGARLSVFA